MPPDDQTTGQSTEAPEDDLHSLISKAFDEHEAPAEPVEKSEPTRQRAPDGKFVKAEAADPEPEAPFEPAAEEKPEEETRPAAGSEPPTHWKAEDKETFKALPQQAQDFLLRRHGEMEADYTRKTQNHAAFVRDYEPVRQVLAPYEAQIRQAGYTPLSLIKAWADVERDLVEGRGVDTVRRLVENYRLDKTQVARALGLPAAPVGADPPPMPEGSQQPIVLPPELQRQLDMLQQGYQQTTQYLTRQQEQQQREAVNRVENTIEAFRSARDSSGNALHPHYDELENDMAVLWKAAQDAGQQPTLDEVYDKAVWANTSTRQKVLDGQRAAEEAQRRAGEQKVQAEARAKAERARKAASSVTGAPGSGQARISQSQAEGGSLRDQINAAFDEMSDA